LFRNLEYSSHWRSPVKDCRGARAGRPLLLGEWPAGAGLHVAAPLLVALAAYWLALTRRRLLK